MKRPDDAIFDLDNNEWPDAEGEAVKLVLAYVEWLEDHLPMSVALKPQLDALRTAAARQRLNYPDRPDDQKEGPDSTN